MVLAKIFTDSMVLQRNKPIKIFGTGDNEVTVTLNGVSAKSEKKDNGRWIATLPEMKEGGPYTLKVSDCEGTVVLNDILIGDVWVVGGQSNAEHPLICDLRGAYEAEQCHNDNIRFYTCKRGLLPDDITYYYEYFKRLRPNEYGQWEKCDEKSALYFSAIGYYISKLIYKELNVPIGVISANKGATRIEAWVPENVFDKSPYMEYMESYEAKKLPDDEADDVIKDYAMDTVRFKEKLDSIGFDYEKMLKNLGPYAGLVKANEYWDLKPMPMCKYNTNAPSGYYNKMIDGQLAPLSIKGFVWYQGESNATDKESYADKFEILTECWRKVFEDNKLPFYTVEIAPYSYGHLCDNMVQFKVEQHRASKLAENCHIISTQNLGDCDNIHPLQKFEVAKRLSNQILNYEYGLSRPCDGPMYSHYEIHNNEIWIYVENSDGLYGYDNDNMEIAGEDGVYMPAVCEIKDGVIVVKNDKITNPVNVRYCWKNYCKSAYIYNESGIPLAAFSTELSDI